MEQNRISGGSGAKSTNGCESSSFNDFITGHWWGDLLLSWGLILCVCCCCFLIVLALLGTTLGRRVLYGDEGERVQRTRKSLHTREETETFRADEDDHGEDVIV